MKPRCSDRAAPWSERVPSLVDRRLLVVVGWWQVSAVNEDAAERR